MKSYLALLVTAVLAAHALAQDAVTPDITARFLAGLPVRDTPLEALSRNQSWVDHATEFDKAWKELDARQLSKIRAWSAEFLANAATDKGPMFYMFSGPDILYAQTFFPNASTYVLAGLEPVGAIPDVQHLSSGALGSGLANLRKSLNSVLSFSFLHHQGHEGRPPPECARRHPPDPVCVSRARRLQDRQHRTRVARQGGHGLHDQGRSTPPGVKIVFPFGPSGPQQTLYYFATDLSNEGIKNQPGYTRFCDSLGTGAQSPQGRVVPAALREFHHGAATFCSPIAARSSRDDSGIPIKNFDPA
ncbi:MAG: hypothetical protein WDN28_00090 [Chthoniobacter sp.]